MAVTPKKIIAAQQIPAINGTFYTATGVTTIIDSVNICNTTTAAVLVTVDIVNYGGSAGASERAISGRSIAPGETYTCPELVGQILSAGDSIQGFAGSGSALTIRGSGREVSGS